MKKGTKLIAIAIAALAIFFTTNVKAQTVDKSAWRLGIGVEGGLPTGDLHQESSFELGGSLRLQYGVDKNVAVMLTSGFDNFFGKTIQVPLVSGGVVSEKVPSFGVIPVKAGMKYF